MTIAERLASVRARMDAAARDAGRDPTDVKLLAVSKRHPIAAVDAAVAARQLDFGENTGQELRDKSALRPDLRWHYIGRVQSNKAKYIAPVAYRVHSLEAVRHAEALAKRAPGPLSCLVAVNIGREPQKSGVHPDQVLDTIPLLQKVDKIEVTGLMCIPPYREDAEDVAPFFEELADLAARGRDQGHSLTELSMGMSHDFEVAIRHGATWIRVGTAIFGERPS